MIANGTNFVNETTFDNFPEFQRIHNVDGSFALKSKQFDQLVTLENCTKFNFLPDESFISACSNKSFPNSFNFFGMVNQLRFYVVKKDLGIERAPTNLYFHLAENSDLPNAAGTHHYRPFKINGGKQSTKEPNSKSFWKYIIFTSSTMTNLRSLIKSTTGDIAILQVLFLTP